MATLVGSNARKHSPHGCRIRALKTTGAEPSRPQDQDLAGSSQSCLSCLPGSCAEKATLSRHGQCCPSSSARACLTLPGPPAPYTVNWEGVSRLVLTAQQCTTGTAVFVWITLRFQAQYRLQQCCPVVQAMSPGFSYGALASAMLPWFRLRSSATTAPILPSKTGLSHSFTGLLSIQLVGSRPEICFGTISAAMRSAGLHFTHLRRRSHPGLHATHEK